MAITVNTQILGQQATSTTTYCYLYEPLKIVITESDLTATKIFVDMEAVSTLDGSIVDTLLKYGEYDLNPGRNLTFDIMKLAQQHHDAEVYKFSLVDEISGESIVSKYKYNFNIYSDISGVSRVSKLPILGVRKLQNFVPLVTQSQAINEFQFYNMDVAELESRWNTKVLQVTLKSASTVGNTFPTISTITSTTGKLPCGGFLIWKSTFGGWMFWGFDLRTERFSGSHVGNLPSGMFESTAEIGGNPFVTADYTGISNSYTVILKSLGLTSQELLAVAGISFSPAVYYMEPNSQKMELMRMTSATVPLDSIANGGDFSVSLSSISNTSQSTK
tara:strand:+ start:329 stop:1324 length:996 start_codon:yes stop_codon:yes gene_type:complete